jgi:pyruvate/2-oxoglutarate dehydrogenase complex dihydrolipoamide dehydrogenase (E3) component
MPHPEHSAGIGLEHTGVEVDCRGYSPVWQEPVDSVLRAQAPGERLGFMKVLVGENDDRILGFTMIGAAAGEVMAVVQTAMLAGSPYGRLADAIFAHPTMAEGPGMLFSNVPRRSLQHVSSETAA